MTYYRYVSIAITTTHPIEKLHTSSNVAPVLGGQRCPKRSDEVAPLGARSGGGNGGSHGLPRHRGFDWRGNLVSFGALTFKNRGLVG